MSATKHGVPDGWMSAILLTVLGGLVGTATIGTPQSGRPTLGGTAATQTAPAATVNPPSAPPAMGSASPGGSGWNWTLSVGRSTSTTESPPPTKVLTTRVRARDWEDPLGAAFSKIRGARANELQSGANAAELPTSINRQENRGRTVLVVQMDDGTAAESIDSRMGVRVTTHAAMRRLGYSLVEEETIRAVPNPIPSGLREGDLNDVVAFESWRQSAGTDHDACIVTYVGYRALDRDDSRAMTNAGELVLELFEEPFDPSDVILLRGTTTRLLRDLTEAFNVATGAWIAPRETRFALRCRNYSSTADLSGLLPHGLKVEETRSGITVSWQPYGLLLSVTQRSLPTNVSRTLGSDRELVQLLWDELKRRGVGTKESGDAIAVIAPAATAWGRKLTMAWTDKASSPSGGPTIISIGYPSGLDATPHTAARLRRDVRTSEQAGSTRELSALIASTGESHLDYLFRAIRDASQRLGATTGQRLRAVFVAGDQWDVRMVVAMVREHFPDVLLLTTDLYASYLDVADYPVMRNLLVASHLDLRVRVDLQASAAPFRSSYETSLYLSILNEVGGDLDSRLGVKGRALIDSKEGGLDRAVAELAVERQLNRKPPARLFEVGRMGVVELAHATGITASCPFIEPARGAFQSLHADGRAIWTAVVLGLVGMAMFVLRLKRIRQSRGWAASALIVVLIACVVAIVLAFSEQADIWVTAAPLLILAVVVATLALKPVARTKSLSVSRPDQTSDQSTTTYVCDWLLPIGVGLPSLVLAGCALTLWLVTSGVGEPATLDAGVSSIVAEWARLLVVIGAAWFVVVYHRSMQGLPDSALPTQGDTHGTGQAALTRENKPDGSAKEMAAATSESLAQSTKGEASHEI